MFAYPGQSYCDEVLLIANCMWLLSFKGHAFRDSLFLYKEVSNVSEFISIERMFRKLLSVMCYKLGPVALCRHTCLI